MEVQVSIMDVNVQHETIEKLSKISPFDVLTVEELKWIISKSEVLDIRGPYKIFNVEREQVYVLLRGECLSFRTSEFGRLRAFRYSPFPEVIGLECLLYNVYKPYMLKLYRGARVLKISRDVLLPLLDRPYFSKACLEFLSRLYVELREELVESSFRDTTERLVLTLYRLGTEFSQRTLNESDEINLPRKLSLNDLAALVGSVREVIARSLSGLQRAGIIRKTRRNIILNLAEMRRRYRYLLRGLEQDEYSENGLN